MKTYISGQITGLELSEAEKNFSLAEEELQSLMCIPINPMNILPFHPDHKWEDYMIADIKVLFGCDAIYMLKNWTHSRGARVERAIAFEMGLQIIYQQ